MASRRFNQFRLSLESTVVELFMDVTFGASGAPTLKTTTPAGNQGIASITRNSAGNYTIKLQDTYMRVMGVDVRFVGASAPAAPVVTMVSDGSATAGNPNIVIQMRDSSGTATDPASGEEALIRIALKNSSVM